MATESRYLLAENELYHIPLSGFPFYLGNVGLLR